MNRVEQEMSCLPEHIWAFGTNDKYNMSLLQQALDIPFVAVGASEPNAAFRSVIQANHCVEHMHGTMEEQVAGKACSFHRKASCCKLEACDVCVMGTPCNPFSDMRFKRYRDGTVSRHPLCEITLRDAKNMIVQGGHKAVIMEQVSGFDKPEATRASAGQMGETPMRRPGDCCGFVCL